MLAVKIAIAFLLSFLLYHILAAQVVSDSETHCLAMQPAAYFLNPEPLINEQQDKKVAIAEVSALSPNEMLSCGLDIEEFSSRGV